MPSWLKGSFFKTEDPTHTFIQQNCVDYLLGQNIELDTSNIEVENANCANWEAERKSRVPGRASSESEEQGTSQLLDIFLE